MSMNLLKAVALGEGGTTLASLNMDSKTGICADPPSLPPLSPPPVSPSLGPIGPRPLPSPPSVWP